MELMSMIGRGTIQGFIPRIPALVHEVDLCLGQWEDNGIQRWAMDWTQLPLLRCHSEDFHNEMDRSRRVQTYLADWWNQPLHDNQTRQRIWLSTTAYADHLEEFQGQVSFPSHANVPSQAHLAQDRLGWTAGVCASLPKLRYRSPSTSPYS